MVRSHALLNSCAFAGTSATSPATPDSPYGSPTRLILSHGEADTTRSAGLRAIEQLRKRLDTIDEHTRELRSARHILLRREHLLVHERDELVESLNAIEVALMARVSPYTSGTSSPFAAPGGSIEDTEESDVPSKRQAVSDPADRPTARKRPSGSKGEVAFNRSVSKPAPLTALGTEPTLIAECPPELLHLLQPSNSLPRPPSSSPPGSFVRSPALSPRSASVTRNGIRYPPGSVPRLTRGRSSSPLTQMLPPPLPSSPATPVASKGYYPIIRDLSPAELGSPISCAVTTCDPPVSAPPKLTIETTRAHADSPRLSTPHNGTIPIYLMLNNPASGWGLTHLDPERTPSPPIGAPRSSWVVRPDTHSKRNEYEEFTTLEVQSVKSTNQRTRYEQNGPASRTRARVNGIGAISKGKGRA
ncbi:hypothetical protein RSOL_207280 [Rhizoctonia solani AG-3 Rhs1AP]|uniref:Uncharacterized protein n=2 Tax=Rhizoctonia solani AG-3 TaxID=1086053 RepID=A0A074RQV9_9AGAM|nr:hypothetical protein RSOL_207280 [Rhizoctonia solani AG-3 Rhs1AP]KEP47710.1 hypothetical protein V565_146620 [Rhizoctonia solani 123E]